MAADEFQSLKESLRTIHFKENPAGEEFLRSYLEIRKVPKNYEIRISSPKEAGSLKEKTLICNPKLYQYPSLKQIKPEISEYVPVPSKLKNYSIMLNMLDPVDNGIYQSDSSGRTKRVFLLDGEKTTEMFFHLGRDLFLEVPGNKLVGKENIGLKIVKKTFGDILKEKIPISRSCATSESGAFSGANLPPRLCIVPTDSREDLIKFIAFAKDYFSSIPVSKENIMREEISNLVDYKDEGFPVICQWYQLNHECPVSGMKFCFNLDPPFINPYLSKRPYIATKSRKKGDFIYKEMKIPLKKHFDWIVFNKIQTIPTSVKISFELNKHMLDYPEFDTFPEFVNLGDSLTIFLKFPETEGLEDFDYEKNMRIYIEATGYWFFTWEMDDEPFVRGK